MTDQNDQNQITSGVRSILSYPRIYDTFQNLMGGRKRGAFVDEFVRPEPGYRLLDVGCGTSQVLHFIPEGVEYWGYDTSPEYIAAAKKRYGNRGHFVCGELDRGELDNLPKFDVVLACGLIHHLNDDLAQDLLRLAHCALRPNGRFVAIEPCFAQGQNPIARFIITHDRGRHVRDENEYRRLAEPIFQQVSGVVRHRAWIPYTHWIMECVA